MPVTQAIRHEEAIEVLADYCIAARALIEEVGTTSMRELIDLLLYEVGHALAKSTTMELVIDDVG